jgi:hypothetical protein
MNNSKLLKVPTLFLFFIVSLSFAVSIGCVTTKVWTSTPEIQTLSNDYLDAHLKPLKRGHNFFVSFELLVINKTNKNLQIDWNETKYILNNKVYGVFVFKGIKPEDIKNATVPPDNIYAGKYISKVISPLRLLAGTPRRDLSKDELAISPGIIPVGENGIYLVIRYNNNKIIEKMTIQIEETR